MFKTHIYTYFTDDTKKIISFSTLYLVIYIFLKHTYIHISPTIQKKICFQLYTWSYIYIFKTRIYTYFTDDTKI